MTEAFTKPIVLNPEDEHLVRKACTKENLQKAREYRENIRKNTNRHIVKDVKKTLSKILL